MLFFSILFACTTTDKQTIETGLPEVDPPQQPALQLSPGHNSIQIEQDISGEEQTRFFYINVPSNFNTDSSYPVLFVFHGNGAPCSATLPNGDEIEREPAKDMMNQQTSLADEGNVVLVYPQGYNCMWNLGPEADLSDIERPTASTDEEVLFISDIIDMLSSVEGINDTNIYASGTSNGAAFSHYITAQTEHPFKGIATMVSGLDVDGEPLASQPTISVLQMMNKRDSIIPFDGGESITGHTYLSAEDSILAWATHNGCDVVPQESGNEDAMFYHYPNCTDGVQVTSVAVLPSPWPNECEQAWVSAQENNTPWIPPEGVTCGSGHDISSERLDEDVWLYAWRFLQGEE